MLDFFFKLHVIPTWNVLFSSQQTKKIQTRGFLQHLKPTVSNLKLHMLKLMVKKIFTVLRLNNLLIWT